MQGLDVRSRPRHQDSRTRARFADFNAYLHWVCPALPDPLTMAWSDDLTLALHGGVPRIVGPERLDPLRTTDGATVAPDWALDRLERFAACGVPFQRVAIAHELDPDGPVRDELNGLRWGPRTCSDQEARRLVGQVRAGPGLAGSVRLLDMALSGATSASRTANRPPRKPLISTVFGVTAPTPPRQGDISLWYPLATWRW